jgi:uncharacterized protein
MAEELAERRDVDGRLIERVARPATAVRHGLEPHPEGGWYRRTWASDVVVTEPSGRSRPTATAILFLLPAGETSAWHRVTSDELWIWHGPGALELELGGTGERPVAGETVPLALPTPQRVVPAHVWQRTRPAPVEVLVSCVVSPGFDFADFTLAE